MQRAIGFFLVLGLLAAGQSTLAADGVVVVHHEELASFRIAAAAASGAPKTLAESTVVLSFDALGRHYALDLQPNARLLKATVLRKLRPGIAVYRGQLAGVTGSWARIVVADGMPRGVIWDGSEMLAIEAPGDSAVPSSSPVIYRLKDTYVVPGSMSCGTQSQSANGAVAYEQLLGELGTALAQAPGASRQLDLGAVGDFELFQHFGSDEAATETAVLTRLDVVDGIYSEQLGVQLSVEALDIFTSADDPFTDATDADDLLSEIGSYRQSTPSQRAQGLTHLYTGRNLDGTTVGIAYLDALCDARFGAGLSEGRQGAMFASLIAAHEIGHNFGAEHDAEAGSVCESTPPGFLMEASVNGNDQFSQCSIDTITPRIATASCIHALPTVDMGISLDGSLSPVLLGTDETLAFSASNSGTEAATGVGIDIELPDNVSLVSATTDFGTCDSGAGSVSCSYGSVPGNGQRTVNLTVTATDVGDGTFTATVSADSDVNPGNNEDSETLTVVPAVDLVVDPIASVEVESNQQVDVSIDLENRSTLDASAVAVTIDLATGLRADAASWSLGSCHVTDAAIDCSTDSFAAKSSATLQLSLTGTADGQSTYTVSLSSAEDDINTDDNSVTATVQVGPVSVPGGGSSGGGGGGGGGATEPLVLFLLGAAAGATFRRRRDSRLPSTCAPSCKRGSDESGTAVTGY